MSFAAYVPPKKKKHTVRRVVLAILALLLAAAVIWIAVHFRTLQLASGHGSLKLNSLPQITRSLTQSGRFDNLSQNTDSNGSQVLTGVSKDGAVSLTVTQDNGGHKTVDARIDLSKLDTGNISKSALLHGDTSALQAVRSEADQYLGALVDPGQLTGMETYVAGQLISQYRRNPDSALDVDHTFGGTSLSLNGSLASQKIAIHLQQ